MSERNPREELGYIARSLRRALERERAAGTGGLLLNSALEAAKNAAASAPPGVGPARGNDAAAPQDAMAPAGAIDPADRSDEPAEALSLFEDPAAPRPAGPAPTRPSRPSFDLPPFHDPLNPAGIEARAAIAEAAGPLLEAIAAEVKQCQKCALWESRTQAVPGVGSAKSGIVFVGEGPGADEDRLGEPFVGRAGQLLDKIIEAMENAKLIPGVPLNRGTVFIGNVIHCRPPENRVPLPHEVEMSSPYLMRQLDAIQPRIICCLGKTAAEMLLKTKGTLGGMRGKIYRWKGAKMIVTYHPAACLRNPEYKRPVWEDMQLLAREYLAD